MTTPLAQSERLRIAYLLSQYPIPTQTFARSDVAALRADGHDVSLYTMKPHFAADPCGGVHRPSLLGVFKWPAALWAMRRAVAKVLGELWLSAADHPGQALQAVACIPRAVEIARSIERAAPDVVHLFWARQAALVLALLRRRGYSGTLSSFVGAYDLVADDLFTRLAMHHAAVVVTHCEANRTFLQSRTGPDTRLEVIYRGIPLVALDPPPERDPNLWLTASALVPDKNVEGVIDAFAAARAVRPALVLQVLGEGPHRAALQTYCERKGLAGAVTFGGHRPRAEVFAAMQRAQVFLLLSRKASERLPNAIKEALWAGCRVIASDTVGIAELLPHPGLGIVVNAHDPDAVAAAAMCVLHEDPALQDHYRDDARRWIADHFCAEASMRRYVACWRA